MSRQLSLSFRVFRGGSWLDVIPVNQAASAWFGGAPSFLRAYLGLRLARKP